MDIIGKPVFKKFSEDQFGGWMMDPAPRDPEDYLKVSLPEWFVIPMNYSTVPLFKGSASQLNKLVLKDSPHI